MAKYTAREIADYFIHLDDKNLFKDKTLEIRNGRQLYRGNTRLNKFLHLVQLLYIAKEGEKLFNDDIYAYDNGGVVKEIREKYSIIINQPKKQNFSINGDDLEFLNRFYNAFKNADLDDLIEISHEDVEWIEKHKKYPNAYIPMDLLSRKEIYKNDYKDMLKVMGY